MKTQVWSCGGGVQSAAIAALIIQGLLPKPDYSIIVDTEREKSTTWQYYEAVLKPELAKVGINLERVPKSRYATVDLFSESPARSEKWSGLLIPAFRSPSGQLDTYCSNEWKKRVVMRHCRELGIKDCQNWVGISLDEMRRVRTGPPAWFQVRYPLIYDAPMSRGGCIERVKRMGWPAAPRSSCWMCPHHDDTEWLEMKPDDFAKAVKFEREIQQRDANAWLHQARESLDQVDFKKRIAAKEGCQTGFCFT